MKEYVSNRIIAEPNWCVPATLEMVLNHYGIKDITQYDIANQLNIITDDDTTDHKKWGTQIDDNTFNDFFVNNNISLVENYISIGQFMDDYFMVEKMEELLSEGITIICGFNYTWLYGNGEDTFQHVSIVTEILNRGNDVILLDPGPKGAGYRTVKSNDLYYAIRASYDGLWCIRRKE